MSRKTLTKPVRIAFVGDMHCGHIAGLTPPRWAHGAIDDPDHHWHKLAFTNLPLQFWATKYGGRRCSGMVHYGFTVLTIQPDGQYHLTPYSPNLQWAAPIPMQLSSTKRL